MNYIVIIPTAETSQERTEEINRELYKISRPNWSDKDVTKKFLTEYNNGVTWALGYEDTDFLPVNSDANVTVLKSLLTETATPTELNSLEAYLMSKVGSTVLFNTLIPSSVIIRDYQYMVDNGYINE